MTRSVIQTIALIILLCGCDEQKLTGPPVLRLGRDECAECGMIIDEARSAAALLIDQNGHRQHRLFDDIGCMLDYQHASVDREIIESFVHDYSTSQWIDGRRHYVLADVERLPTPMASGIAAFADETAAARSAEKFAGNVLSDSEVIAAREAWRLARLRKAGAR